MAKTIVHKYSFKIKTLARFLTVCAFTFLSWPSIAQVEGVDYVWQEKRDRDGIKIYTSSVDGSPYKAVRGTMLVKGKVDSFVALVEDIEKCSVWVYRCHEARVIQRISDTESYTYIYNDLPFPAKDRDAYAHTRWTLVPAQNRITMTSIAKPNGPPASKALRIESAVTQWHFTSQPDGTVLIENFAHVDPDGITPAWFANKMLVSSAYKTLFGMRKLVESGAYKDMTVKFLQRFD